MDLREKIPLIQRASEYSIRFRLLEMLLMAVLCTVALFNIDGVLVSIQPLSDQASAIMTDIVHGDFQEFTTNFEIIFVVLALFLFRWKFFGFKCGLLWFLFLLLIALFMAFVAEYKDIMPILIAGIFIVAITGFFFVRSLFIKSIFPSIFLAYALSAWFLFLGISYVAWFGFISLFFADIAHMVFGLRYNISENAKKKKTLEGAIAHMVRKSIPVGLLSLGLLIVLEIAFHFTDFPPMASGKLGNSIVIYFCYAFWMPFFAAALLSFCPLESTCEKIQQKSK